MVPDPADTDLRFFATAAKGAEALLAEELRTMAVAADWGEPAVTEERGGVSFAGSLAFGYRACLWSRLAQRVLLQLATLPLEGGDAFWERLATLDWTAHLAPDGTLAVDFGGLGSSVGVTNTLFGAQRTKDVIVDQFRERFGRRPSVDPARPDVRVNVYVNRREALVSLDLSGESLHRRGYREPGRQTEAPLKETLAAAILTRAGWPAVAAAGGSVVDPLCGSGTLPIEAALIAADVAPGLLRAPEAWGFTGWLGHKASVWNELVAEAGERRDAALARLRAARALPEAEGRIVPGAKGRVVPIAFGFDRDTRAVELARADVARAGLEDLVAIERRDLAALTQPDDLRALTGRSASRGDGAAGLVVANPPYGHRLGADAGSARPAARSGRDGDGGGDRGRDRSRHARGGGESGNNAATRTAPDPALGALYALLGERLRVEFTGWRAAILVNDLELGKRLGLRARRANHFMNGPLHCTLLRIDVNERAAVPLPERRMKAPPKDRLALMEESLAGPQSDRAGDPAANGASPPSGGQVGSPSPCTIGQDLGQLFNVPDAPQAPPAGTAGASSAARTAHASPAGSSSSAAASAASAASAVASAATSAAAKAAPPPTYSPAAEQFANRLRKNARRWGRYMRRAGTTCYRVYDADLPDFAVAVDVYERWVHVQEYAPPPEIEEAKAAGRLAEAMRVIPEVLGVEAADVFLKVRSRQRGAAQYARQAAQGIEHEVHEGGLSFLVNFTDYLDTGLFLSGREVRRLLGELAPGQRFLNLFGYTGTASVAAGRGGATSTTTVDLNGGYLEWTQRNLARNKLKSARNAVIEADVLQWVDQTDERFGLIYLDPPTFSNSKKMGRATFDVRRDHADLIRLVARRLLAPGGVVIFACNARRFSMDSESLARDLRLDDLSRATLPPDFARSARAHHVWQVTARE